MFAQPETGPGHCRTAWGGRLGFPSGNLPIMDAGAVSAAGAPASDSDAVLGIDEPAWRVIRWVVCATYVLATLVYTHVQDSGSSAKGGQISDVVGRIPYDREVIVGWMLGFVLINLLGRPRRQLLVTIGSWAPFLLALYLYDFARSVGHRLDRPIAVAPQIAIDKALGLGRLPTEVLQNHLFDPNHIRWYDVFASAVYMSHFFVPYLFAGYLWRRGQRIWRWYAASFVGMTFTACVVFAVYATAPPWYAAKLGLINEFPRVIVSRGWSHVGLRTMERVITKGQNTVNPFAAIPSLHSAEALLVVLFLWPTVKRWTRVLLLAYPLAMGFTLVYAGEHYAIDVLVGWGFVGAALTLGWWLRQQYGWQSPWVRSSTIGHRHTTN